MFNILNIIIDMNAVAKLTYESLENLKANPESVPAIMEAIDLIWKMRNVCADTYRRMEYQTNIVSYDNGVILNNVISLVEFLPTIEPQTESIKKCFNLSMELLGNLVVGHIKNQEIIVVTYGYFLRQIFACQENSKNYVYMIYYNAYYGSPNLEESIVSHAEAMDELLNAEDGHEFGHYFMELFFERCSNFELFYKNVRQERRPKLLRLILEKLKKDDIIMMSFQLNRHHISFDIVRNCSEFFKSQSLEVLVQFKLDDSSLAWEACNLLELLACISSQEYYLTVLQQDVDLYYAAIDLLFYIHKNDGDELSNLHDVFSKAGVKTLGLYDIDVHPTYAYKSNLVRLIANLSYHNTLPYNNLTEERRGLLRVLLECSCIDPLNPFITQWCVFTIRNLCENDAVNKRLLETFKKEAPINPHLLAQLDKGADACDISKTCAPKSANIMDMLEPSARAGVGRVTGGGEETYKMPYDVLKTTMESQGIRLNGGSPPPDAKACPCNPECCDSDDSCHSIGLEDFVEPDDVVSAVATNFAQRFSSDEELDEECYGPKNFPPPLAYGEGCSSSSSAATNYKEEDDVIGDCNVN